MAKDPTRLALARAGREFVKQLKSDVKNRHYASGRMMRSIDYRVVDNVVEIIADRSLSDISYGTKPTGKNPSEAMVSRIVEWMKYKNMRPLARGRGGRFRKQTPSARRSAAFAVARGILQKGIKGSGIIEQAYAKVSNKIEGHIMVAFKERIKEELEIATKDLKV